MVYDTIISDKVIGGKKMSVMQTFGTWFFFAATFTFQFLILSSVFFLISREFVFAKAAHLIDETPLASKRMEKTENLELKLTIKYIIFVAFISYLVFVLAPAAKWELTFAFKERLTFALDMIGLMMLHLFQLSAFVKLGRHGRP
jgi:hypothetical protein